MIKPIILYIDDEPMNLTVFEAALPGEWDIKTFTDPLKALEALEVLEPSVIVTDQRMPNITGVKFLELARKLRPHAVRIVVTGYSEEDLVIDSVRKARIFDYIKKPWEPEDLESSIRGALSLYEAEKQSRELHEQLVAREAALEKQNRELIQLTSDLQGSSAREHKLRQELECWVPPFLLQTLNDTSIKFPMKRDLVGITFDIIGSSDIHSKVAEGRPLRSVIIQSFTSIVLKHGGWRESHAGDSAYGHFGLLDSERNPFESALAAAREFRVSLQSISQASKIPVECGIALHVATDCMVDIHKVQIVTEKGILIQKSFDTTSLDIDLLHRMEKAVHSLKGSNIIMSGQFIKALGQVPTRAEVLGEVIFRGQKEPVELYLIKSDMASPEDLQRLRAELSEPTPPLKLVS